MASRTTDEAIKEFKAFVKRNPEIMASVKGRQKPWKDVFEEWVIFGEDHDVWKDYGVDDVKAEENDTDDDDASIGKFLQYLSSLDPDSVHKHLDQINGALTNIQDIIGQLQPNHRGYNLVHGNGPAMMQPHPEERFPMYKKD